MSSVTPVPETQLLLSQEDLIGHAVDKRIRTNQRIVREAFIRFRYGEGISNARASGLQLSLTTVPLMIAIVGLSDTFYAERIGAVVRRTILSLTPGASDPMVRTALEQPQGRDVSQFALWFGMVAAVIAMTTAMGQVERGANRIYGIQRDRPTMKKYSRAFVMVFAAGLPATMAYAILLAGPSFGEAVEREFGREDDVVSVVALPLGVALLLMSVTIMLRFSPRRHQPGWAFLAVGAFAALLLPVAFTAGVAIYLSYSDDFGGVYGPLTAMIVLLLWSQMTGIAILYGAALCAQIEAESAGVHDGAQHDTHAGQRSSAFPIRNAQRYRETLWSVCRRIRAWAWGSRRANRSNGPCPAGTREAGSSYACRCRRTRGRRADGHMVGGGDVADGVGFWTPLNLIAHTVRDA